MQNKRQTTTSQSKFKRLSVSLDMRSMPPRTQRKQINSIKQKTYNNKQNRVYFAQVASAAAALRVWVKSAAAAFFFCVKGCVAVHNHRKCDFKCLERICLFLYRCMRMCMWAYIKPHIYQQICIIISIPSKYYIII